jgi:hypothetical protein
VTIVYAGSHQSQFSAVDISPEVGKPISEKDPQAAIFPCFQSKLIISTSPQDNDTNKMITNPSKSNFIFKFIMAKDFTTYCVESRVYDFGMFDALFVGGYGCDALRETFYEFFGVVVEDWGEDFDGWK